MGILDQKKNVAVLSFPLRNIFKGIYKGNAKLKVVLETPCYLLKTISTLEKMKNTGKINGTEHRYNYRIIYNKMIQDLLVEDILEQKLPILNWRDMGSIKMFTTHS